MTVFGIDHKVGVDQTQFMNLCPALIQQFYSGVCGPPAKTTTTPGVTKDMAKSKLSITLRGGGFGQLNKTLTLLKTQKM